MTHFPNILESFLYPLIFYQEVYNLRPFLPDTLKDENKILLLNDQKMMTGEETAFVILL